jgi:hypothetical protein
MGFNNIIFIDSESQLELSEANIDPVQFSANGI